MSYSANEVTYVFNGDRGFLSFLWPNRVQTTPHTLLDPRLKYLLFSDLPTDVVGIDYIRISATYGGLKIDTKDGFMELLLEEKRASKRTVNSLALLEGREFWIRAKLAWYKQPFFRKPLDEGMFQLFDAISRMKFGACYRLYRQLGLPHHVVMSSVLTFLIKAKDGSMTADATKQYKLLLARLHNRMPRAMTSVVRYCDSRRQEDDFLSFLLDICTQ